MLMRYIDAFRAQGENLRASRAAVSGQLAGLDLASWREARLGLVGMGASYNAVLALLGCYWASGLRAAAWLGSDLVRPGAVANIDAAVAISQTGRSAELVASLAALPAGLPRLALTDDPRSPVADAAGTTVSLSLLEDSEVRTLGYTGTLQALGQLRDALAVGQPAPDWDWLADETGRQVPLAEGFAERVLPEIRRIRSFDVVGSGAQFGSAAQAALLLREVSRLPGAAYDTYEYLHGPVEAAEPGLALIVVGGAREVKLAVAMVGVGATVILVTAEDVGRRDGLFVYGLPECDDALRPVLEILPAQTIALALAEDGGLPVGEFRHHQDDTKVA
jgi:glutamine---fructose-6-phosphate transaminase (isomerizing)